MRSTDSRAASLAIRLFGGSLPPEVLLDVRRRLRIASLACFLGFVMVLGVHLILVQAGWAQLHHRLLVATSISSLASLGMFFLFGMPRWTPPALWRLGALMELQLCLCLSQMELRGPDPRHPELFGVSLAAVIIVLAPVLIPAPPWKTLLLSVVAATMGPGALVSLGQTHTFHQVFNLYAVNYVAAGLSLVPALVLGRMREDLQAAREFGNYQLLERLGQGGMGEVWSARHRMLARPAALKLITTPDALLIKRFEHEVQATSTLRSPHTITVYDYGIGADGSFYYVMELLDGLDLAALVDKHGAVSPARAVFLLAQVLDSLEEAHAQGLVHRDIKPENVYVCRLALRGDFVKVLDFGLALCVNVPADARLTAPNAIHGTPAYMAPEQALELEVDGRADLYAVACLGYWLLTGKTVFDARVPVEHILHHVNTAAPKLSVDAELASLLVECLDKDPQARPANARALRDRLLACHLSDTWTQADADAWWTN